MPLVGCRQRGIDYNYWVHDRTSKGLEYYRMKHNRDATVISMILGFTTLALFVDGLLRLLGIIPPFMEVDINILERIVDRVEVDVLDKIKQVPIQKIFNKGKLF